MGPNHVSQKIKQSFHVKSSDIIVHVSGGYKITSQSEHTKSSVPISQITIMKRTAHGHLVGHISREYLNEVILHFPQTKYGD